MKINMYMFDRPIELDEESTDEFLIQYKVAKDTMRQILTMYEDEETRSAMFFAMSLRTLLDDFLDFCTDDIDVDTMEALLNNEEVYLEDNNDDDDFEIEVDTDN